MTERKVIFKMPYFRVYLDDYDIRVYEEKRMIYELNIYPLKINSCGKNHIYMKLCEFWYDERSDTIFDNHRAKENNFKNDEGENLKNIYRQALFFRTRTRLVNDVPIYLFSKDVVIRGTNTIMNAPKISVINSSNFYSYPQFLPTDTDNNHCIIT